VKSLNALYGEGQAQHRPARLAAAHAAVHHHLFETFASTKPVEVPPTPRVAFNELLGGLKDSYHGVGSKIKLFDADRVARPKLGRSPIQVETILGHEAYRILDPERMLVEKEVFAGRCRDDPVHLYGDKILGRSAKARAEF